MGISAVVVEGERTALGAHQGTIELKTRQCLEFVDLTERVREIVARSRVRTGWVNVQTRHTTTAILVGESEPLLMEDLKRQLERLAPRGAAYRHDDFSVRTVNMCPDEEKNGHAHCKALLLRASESINVVESELDLGQWQRIFLVELDRARTRTVSVIVLGEES